MINHPRNDAQRWAKCRLSQRLPLGTEIRTYNGLTGVIVAQDDPAYVVIQVPSGATVKVGRLTIDREFSVVHD
jgi:preprotein translocase subunit YajC